MRSKWGNLTGTGKVYRFTLEQMTKGKANIIALLILMLFTVGSVPAMVLMWGGEEKISSDITAVYVNNDTGYEISLEEAAGRNEMFSATVFTDTDLTEENYGETITDSELFVFMERSNETGGFSMKAFSQEAPVFSSEERDSCTDVLSTLFDEARLRQQNAKSAQIEILTSGYSTSVQTLEEYQEAEEEEGFDARFFVQMAYSILMLTLCCFASAFIIQKVIEEKTSKLVEMLMVSVKPLALLVGKILAVMIYIFGLLILLGGSFVLSLKITGMFLDTSVFFGQIASMGITADAFRISPWSAAAMIISLLLGYLTISLISGILGTGCSSAEDVEPANMVVVLLVMAGYMGATITVGFSDQPIVVNAMSLLPIFSAFAAPTHYIMQDIGFGTLCLSWLIQIGVIALLAFACAKIYRDLIMYRGKPMKLRGYIALMKQKKKGEVR